MKIIETNMQNVSQFIEIAKIYREHIEIVPKDGIVSIRMSDLLYKELERGKII